MGMKDAYHHKVDAQLREWSGWIEEMKTASASQPVGQKDEHQRSIENLEELYQIARLRLDDLRSSSGAHWENAKQVLEQALIALKHALDDSGLAYVGKPVLLQSDRSHVFEPFYHRKG